MYIGQLVLRVAVAGLVHIEAKGGRLLYETEAEQAHDLECVVPVHGDLDVTKRVQLGQILRLLERLSVKRRIGRLGDCVASKRTDTIEGAYNLFSCEIHMQPRTTARLALRSPCRRSVPTK